MNKNPFRSSIENEILRQQEHILRELNNDNVVIMEEAKNWTGITGTMREILDELDDEPVRKFGLAVIDAAEVLRRAAGSTSKTADLRDLGAIVAEFYDRLRKGKL